MKLRTFTIATRDGPATRRGYVIGKYAAHNAKYWWQITHVPTGRSAPVWPRPCSRLEALTVLGQLADGSHPFSSTFDLMAESYRDTESS